MRKALTLVLTSLAAPAAGDISLVQPIECTLGDSCYIQQYMDRDPSENYADFRGFSLSYDGHKGTDFAVPTVREAQAGINILAAADGTVLGTRDEMADVWSGQFDADTITGRDCGNGLVIDHGGGWHTQYCHMKQGSVAVQQGMDVKAGDVLGQLGMSGRTQFPHLHLSVRKDGAAVDPFDPDPKREDDSLWRSGIEYQAGGILQSGFSTRVPDYAMVKAGSANEQITRTSPAIVGFSFAFGGRTGDILRMTLTGPGNLYVSDDYELPRNRAQFFRAIGKKRRGAPWPGGEYTLKTVLLRAGVPVSEQQHTAAIPR